MTKIVSFIFLVVSLISFSSHASYAPGAQTPQELERRFKEIEYDSYLKRRQEKGNPRRQQPAPQPEMGEDQPMPQARQRRLEYPPEEGRN